MKIEFRGKELEIGKRTLIMGILNMTPDSFSDGGDYNTPEKILERGKRLIEEGADILDVGGQSTRPGHQEVSLEEEIERVVNAVQILSQLDTIISVDTYRAEVAKAALEAGAHMINDVWGLQKVDEPEMAQVVAKYGAAVVVMHNQNKKEYTEDIMLTIRKFLEKSIKIGVEAGILKERILIDVGIGFGKTPEQNMEVLRRMGELKDIAPILLGTSRKSVIGNEKLNLPPKDRLACSITTNVMGIERGAEILRVHDVKELKQAAFVVDTIMR
jgi:dihydropteroate synthase